MSALLLQSFPMLEGSRAQAWAYAPEYRRPRHFHAEPELNLVVAGTATFGVGDGTVELGRGDLLGFPAGQDHALLRASPDLVLFAVGLHQDFVRAGVGRDAPALTTPLRARLSVEDTVDLERRVGTLVGCARADQSVAELWEVARWACERRAVRLGAVPHVLTRRTLGLLGEDPGLLRSDVARLARAAPSEVSRFFGRDLGVTLADFRTRLRLLRFIERVDAAMSLTAAAFDAGFGSYSQCHRSFCATLGMPPRSFFTGGVRRAMQDAFEAAPPSV